ncbi:dehydrogenase [Streptomyces sp. Je 1-79]|uniref:dehydrogenase n=1 Tax=Streptomyces sp. Je 1-79 TaxID=2943847 RepID=UPI0021A7630B|nr:dehydrogenase [Streptomyces sp. Je 1-79]MCT4356201.1 dehydrogenase [Streptomyces sp. Je 1-79]
MSVSLNSPVGKWAGTVTHDGEVDEYTVVFEEDGSVAITTRKSGGSGTWTAKGGGAFEFTVREVFNADVGQISPNGHRAAYIQIDLAAQLSESGFTGTGKAVVHGPDDSVIYATDAETTARPLS